MRRFLLLPCISMLIACEPIGENLASPIADYAEARQVFWSELYTGRTKTLYCDMEFFADERDGVNIEHVFPMSWVTKALDCGTRNQCRETSRRFNLIEGDLHNLYPSRSKTNSARASFRFDNVRGESRKFGKNCDFEVDYRARAVEPRPAVRGEIARAMFYMAWRYRNEGLTIFARSGKILQQWHNEDAPSDAERSRNDKIAYLQGNRNQFVDEPEKLNQLIEEGYFY